MAKYDSTKFYWLQLKEDFFDDDAIDWLEEQPNGKEYSLFYLKLCLKSLRSHGVLIRKVGNMLVPYDHVKLGELTKTSPDTVMVAMNLLIQIGLVQKLDNGELYITQVEEMIGSQSKSAFKKQQQRLTKKDTLLLEGGQGVDICPPEEEKEKELELELELEEEKEKEEKPKKASKKEPNGYDAIISQSSFNDEVKETIIEFVKMRKLIKKPMTDFALKKLLNKLSKISSNPQTQISVLEKSILNNWQDIYEPKEDEKPKEEPAKPIKRTIYDIV